MFRFMHGYMPKYWDAQVKAGLVGENDGIRFCQSLPIKDELKFNKLAAKGGELYKIISDRKCAFYIDRLQGGVYIDEYPYDEELLNEYREMLGDKFLGFQIHEWMSNYRNDVFQKLDGLDEKDWTKENIEAFIYKKFPFPYLFLESMTAEEIAESKLPKNASEFYKNITEIYKKRAEIGELLPCDSTYLAYGFEVSCGAKRLMPEVGAQTADARVQIRYARGMTRKDGRSFGVYYEPWGGEPFSACCYATDGKNEWGIGESSDFPFETQGPNGGSSRSLQMRIFLYSYLCNAEFISEEWGLCNTFYDSEKFVISPYGETKKEFLEFVRKYTDIGECLTPVAAVLPKDFAVLDNLYRDNIYCGFEVESDELAKIKEGIRTVFAQSLDMLGNEIITLKNSDIPDAIDLVNFGEAALDKYDYLVDLTCDGSLAENSNKVCSVDSVKKLLREILPCYVDGNAHWMVNECTSGGYYLTVFNHSGIERTVEKGEVRLPEATSVLTLTVKDKMTPTVCDGDGELYSENGIYKLSIPAGGYSFIKISGY